MKYLSICSGIEAASVAWHDLQWQAVGFSEIEPFPCAVLSHRYPATPNFGDMTRHANWNIEPGAVDLVVGGTPCQAFSVAGLRAGMADPRGNLALTFLAIVDRLRPQWVVWENVPGVLSSNGGRDFGAFVGALVELGYGFAYRVLDAQHFGVAQRRRRVFVVANLTDWRRAAAVLFEPESLRGDSAPRRAKGQGATAGAGNGAETNRGMFWNGSQVSQTLDAVLAKGQTMPEKNRFPAVLVPPLAPTLDASYYKGPGMRGGQERAFVGVPIAPAPAPVVIDRAAFNQGEGAQYPPRIEASETMSALVARGPHAVAAPAPAPDKICEECGNDLACEGQDLCLDCLLEEEATPREIPFVKAKRARSADDDETWQADRPAPTLSVFDSGDTRATVAIVTPPPIAVRRLTPVECERLQGFPDDWTAIPYRGKPAADGPRYKAIGNSMAVPVMRWIGERIDAVDKATKVQP